MEHNRLNMVADHGKYPGNKLQTLRIERYGIEPKNNLRNKIIRGIIYFGGLSIAAGIAANIFFGARSSGETHFPPASKQKRQ